jgi:hypothetical protein
MGPGMDHRAKHRLTEAIRERPGTRPDVEQQALLAEALNMLFERYGKTTRAQMLGTWRKARIP